MKSSILHYPWLSITLAIIAMLSFFILANPSFLIFYKIPDIFFNSDYQAAVLLVVLCIMLWDMHLFFRKKYKNDAIINELFIAKKQLQNKAHSYAAHSDKLKLFISERLLEYIQYDEKFLHFKNIAAEVRHNGVICFDKVQTALAGAIGHYSELQKHEDIAACRDAVNDMRYLWDLLDLSTADNIALHIGDYLCECEEQYFQQLLQKDGKTPYHPTFNASNVLISTLAEQVEAPERLRAFGDSGEYIDYRDALFSISAESKVELLGNENHFRLILENLLSNAQFYANKKTSNKNQPSVVIRLSQSDHDLSVKVYNRGKHIDEDNGDKVFQLGYSTRRKKENHGKGLGLYFVRNIVQGYEGSINFTNISNQPDFYSLRFELDNNEPITDIAETIIENKRVVIKQEAANTSAKQKQWKFSQAIKAIDVYSKYENNTYRFTIDNQDSLLLTDPKPGSIPTWSLTLVQKKRSSLVVFAPIDNQGVQFNLRLPLATTKLDYHEDIADIDGGDVDQEHQALLDVAERFKT
ncbi:MAG: sensor histidine kinase [Pseudomonadota bacterium]